MPVNSTTWKKLAWVPRETKFDNDNALIRINQWANGSQAKYASAFLWNNGSGAGLNPNNYRLPVGDIYNGKLTLVPRAIFSAATIVSGAHGGLDGVVGDEERDQLKRVLTQIYDQFREKWNDRRQIPPWLRGGNEMGKAVAATAVNASSWHGMPVVNAPWNTQQAVKDLQSWADGDLREYRKGFLWWDRKNPENKESYKLPVATVQDGQMVIVAAALDAVAGALAAGAGVEIPDHDCKDVEAVVASILENQDNEAVTAAVFTDGQPPLYPPREWFEDPHLPGPTQIAVTADGRVMGHLAGWGMCHVGLKAGKGICREAPRNESGYKFFQNGHVMTASGEPVKVGRITMDTTHPDINLGWVATADHYSDTGKAIAAVAVGEDRHGIWVAGSVLTEVPPSQIQKLRMSPLSGDWRPIHGKLELVGALAVNDPGFPIVASGNGGDELVAMVAVGVIDTDGRLAHDAATPLSEPDRNVLAMVSKLGEDMDRLLKLSRKAQLKTLLKGK